MKKFCFAIRKLTIAPFMAAVLLTILWFCRPAYFLNPFYYWYSMFFLVLLPVLGYPVQKYIPAFKDRGREGQRSLAMLFAVAGYVLGCIANLFFHSTGELWIIYLEYLISGILILLFNKCFHKKASGHACGIIGPLALLIAFGIYSALIPGLFLVLLVYYASMQTGRHSLLQLIGGSVIPAAVIILLLSIFWSVF